MVGSSAVLLSAMIAVLLTVSARRPPVLPVMLIVPARRSTAPFKVVLATATLPFRGVVQSPGNRALVIGGSVELAA